MADFAQYGVVPTLHHLCHDHVFPSEAVLGRLARNRPVGLVLPALYSEFERPAIYNIIEQLQQVTWLRRIVLVLSDAGDAEYERVCSLLAGLPAETTVLWREGPAVQQLLADLGDAGLGADLPGKGRACWLALGYLLACGDCEVIAFQDCDIKTYHRQMLARLVYPLLDPDYQFEFAKAYYPRLTRQMNGRVTRLFVTPLIQALFDAGVHSRFLRFLESFRYALSGEIALTAPLARGLRLSPGWGLEISTLEEVYRHVPASRVCQVDISDAYDHKHQDISAANPDAGLHRMVREIAIAVFQAMCRDGVTPHGELLQAALPLGYRAAALECVQRYAADASFNRLDYDRHAEECAVEVFADALCEAAREFAADPMGTPPLPCWQRVRATLPRAMEEIVAQEDVAAA